MLVNVKFNNTKLEENKKYIVNNNKIKKEKNNKINENKNEINYSKEDLKDIANFTNFLKINNSNILDIIENFEFKDSGGESNAYKVDLKKCKKTCLLKLIIKEKREKRNKNEIIIANKLKHKNIIDLIYYSPIQNSESDFILMEYGQLGNLKSFLYNVLKKYYYSESTLCYIAYQVLHGLKYMKKYKIVHYDIKPQNIIIDEELNIKLIDFSVSLDYNKITSDTIKLNLAGTNFYMPPEVINAELIELKNIHKIDIYSLGVLLYNFSFGCYPYSLTKEDSKQYDKIYEKIMNNNLEINNDNNEYSNFFIDFLKKLLEKDINKRINIEEALEHYWIKGASLLMDEKEKLFNAKSFLINLIMDHIYSFNNYLQKK